MMKAIILLGSILLSLNAYGQDNSTAVGKLNHIKLFQVDGESGVFFHMDGLDSPSGCGTSASRVLIKGDHPSHDAVLSAALASKLADKTIRLNYKHTCIGKSDSWDFNYFQID